MEMSTFVPDYIRVYLAVFFTAVAGFYTLRILFIKSHANQEIIFPGRRFCATWWNHIAFRFFRVAIWMVCLLRWPFPEIDDYLGVIQLLSVWPIMLLGCVMLTLGFLLAISVHVYHGDAWRSGIDPKGPSQLKTSGVYLYSRNPMFSGVALAQAGFFLALPSFFTATCLVIGWYTLYSQILAEEKHLLQVFPDQYPDYKGQVRRWF